MASALLSTHSIPEIANQSFVEESIRHTVRTNATDRAVYVQPPDKGWGWVVVFVAFVCSAIVDGLIFSFPCVFGLIVDDINASYWIALLSAAFQIFSYLIIGPVISKFLRQEYCRHYVCTGAIVASAGFICSSLIATELPSNFLFLLILTLGICAGSGLGCVYISSICAVSCFFVRHRIAATTVALSGSGVGMAVFPPLIAYLTNGLDFTWTMYLYSAISLQGVALGLLIWPLADLPPGCDLYAGKLPREKDIFDYIREQFGNQGGGSRDSDLSLHTRELAVRAVQEARHRRIQQLRLESECDPQWMSRMDSAGDSQSNVGVTTTSSPIRDFINRRFRRGISRTTSEAPSSSPASTQSGPSTPVPHPHKTAPVLNSSLEHENGLGSSAKRQNTIPDQIFNQVSQGPAEYQSMGAGILTADNVSVVTDLGRKMDECSDVSEFMLVFDPQNTPNGNLLKAVHNPRYKSVSECIAPNASNSAGILLSADSVATDMAPASQSSADDEINRSVVEQMTNLGSGSASISPSAIGVEFVIGSVTEDDVNGVLMKPQNSENAKSEDKTSTSETNMPRIDSEVGELPEVMELLGKRMYRRQSSGNTARQNVLRQRSSQKTEQLKIDNPSPSANQDAILQLMMSEQSASADSADEFNQAKSEVNTGSTSKLSNGQLATGNFSASSPKNDGGNQEAELLPSGPLLSLVAIFIDIRLFIRGPRFPILCFANAFAMAGIFVPLMFFPLRLIWSSGLQPSLFAESALNHVDLISNARWQGACLVGIAGAVGCLSRLGVVAGTEFRRCNSLLATTIAFFLLSFSVVVSTLSSGFLFLAILIGIIAICTELFVSMTTSLIRWTFQPQNLIDGPCDAALVNPAFSLLTVIRAFSALLGVSICGQLYSLADFQGSCFLVLPFSSLRSYGIGHPASYGQCDQAFANVAYFASSVLFISFILHFVLLIWHVLQRRKAEKLKNENDVNIDPSNKSTTTNGTFLLQKIDESANES